MRVAWLVIALVCCAEMASAQERVAFSDVACSADGALLRALLDVELADAGAVRVDDTGDAEAQVTLVCAREAGSARIVIVRDEETRVRELDDRATEAHERLFALAIAELVIATRPRAQITGTALATPTEDPPAAPPPIASPPAPASEPSVPAIRLRIPLSLAGAYWPLATTWQTSLRAGLRLDVPAAPWAIELAVRGGAGAGARESDTSAVFLAVELAGLAVARLSDLDVGAGLEVATGPAWTTASRDHVEVTFVDPIVQISARGSIVASVARDFGLTIDARIGWAVVGSALRASDVTVVGIDALVVALDAGVAFDVR